MQSDVLYRIHTSGDRIQIRNKVNASAKMQFNNARALEEEKNTEIQDRNSTFSYMLQTT